MGESLPNEAIKDFPVFGNLTDLRLHWTFGDMHDWDEVVKMLQNCPKLQTLLIDEVCLSYQCMHNCFYLFSSSIHVFLQILLCFSLTVYGFINHQRGLEIPR